jgi:hypothetical protein
MHAGDHRERTRRAAPPARARAGPRRARLRGSLRCVSLSEFAASASFSDAPSALYGASSTCAA